MEEIERILNNIQPTRIRGINNFRLSHSLNRCFSFLTVENCYCHFLVDNT